MNWLTALRNQIKTNEASTKRGIAMVVTGGMTLYLTFKGHPVDFDTLLSVITQKVDFYVGIGMAAAGLLGVFLPDEPKTVQIQLPPIDLIGQAGMVDRTPPVADRRAADQRVQQPVRPLSNTIEAADHDANFPGWGS